MSLSFDTYEEISAAQIEAALDFGEAQILNDLPQFTDKFQKAYSENGFYEPIENNYWTTGFWTGEVCLAYEYALAKNRDQDAEKLRRTGMVHVDSFYERITKKIEVDHKPDHARHEKGGRSVTLPGADTAGSIRVGEINGTSGISDKIEHKSIQRTLCDGAESSFSCLLQVHFKRNIGEKMLHIFHEDHILGH